MTQNALDSRDEWLDDDCFLIFALSSIFLPPNKEDGSNDHQRSFVEHPVKEPTSFVGHPVDQSEVDNELTQEVRSDFRARS